MRSSEFFNRLYCIIGLPWFFLVVFTSGVLTIVKIILLFLLMIICVGDIIIEKIKLNLYHTIFVTIFICYCIFSFILGITANYEFEFEKDFALIQNYIIAPICILLFSTVFGCSKVRKKNLWRVIVYFTCFLVILDVLKLTANLIGIESILLEFIEISSNRIQDGELTLRIKNEASMFFLLPISIYTAFNSNDNTIKSLCILTSLFGVIYGAMSGRKMLEILILLTAFFALTYKRNITKEIKRHMKLIIFSGCLIIVLFTFLINYFSEIIGIEELPQLITDTIVNGLSSQSIGMSKRMGNTEALFNLWLESPIFGNGLNSYAIHSLASGDTKWSYEVFYIAWLAQTGIIGIILLLCGELYIVKRLIHMGNTTKNRKYYALLAGFSSFIIAGASNPLLYFVWPWSIVLSYCTPTSPKLKNRIKINKIHVR